MKKLSVILVLAGLTIFAACSKKSNPGKVKLTTYTGEVMPLIQTKCAPCHLPSQKGFKANFETYESATRYAAEMVDRIELNPGDRGFMPLKHEKLSAEEIAVFKKWISDGLKEK